jgi:hypothetical protein
MKGSKRSGRRLAAVIVSVALAVAVSDGVLISVGHAQQEDSLAANYGIYNGQVAAAADREQVGTTVDSGFTSGAVDNYYPFARVDVAVAGTSAAASPADTGPFAQAVFGGQNVQQPQYVFAQYPGTQNPPPYSAGSASASASATPAAATAAGTYGSVGTTTSAPPGSQPDGSDGGTASTSSYFDSTLGFVTTGDSRVHHASYGAGVLVIDNVHVGVQVSTTGNGTFTKAISVTVGGATVGTVPVTIDQNGVTVQGQNLPATVVQAEQAAVNAALAGAGVSAHTVTPEVTQDGSNLHVNAEGVVVDFVQPVAPGGVPTQSGRHTLGEVVLDNEATPTGTQSNQSGSGGSGDNSGSTTTVPSTTTGSGAGTGGAAAATAAPHAAAPAGTVPVAALITQPRPKWLLLAYLAWQALMVALVGALYLRRSAQRRVA